MSNIANQFQISIKKENSNFFSNYKAINYAGKVLSPNSFKLYLWFLQYHHNYNFDLFPKKAMADLEFSRSSYERAIRELKKEKFLVYVKTIGINYQYNFYEYPLNIIEDGLIHIGGIYAIYNKETNEVLYVGKTEKELNKREKQHILKLKKRRRLSL